MAFHILPKERTFSQDLGNILGTGLGQGLNILAQNKLHDIHSAKFAKSLESIGIAPNVANFVSKQSPEFQRDFFNRLEGLELNAPTQEQATARVSKELPPTSGIRLAPSKEKQKMMHEEQKMINKEVFPYVKELQQKAKGAKENDIRLNKMEKLIETGKLNSPQFASALKTLKHGIWGLGLDLTGALSPESQEFEKLSNDFIKNAKDVFGNRITDTDLKSFLSTIPNLIQSNEGKVAVIKNLKLMNKAAEVREKAGRKLLKEYGNKLPIDFEARVEDMIKPELDNIAQEFESISSQKPAGTTSFLADLLNAPGKILLK